MLLEVGGSVRRIVGLIVAGVLVFEGQALAVEGDDGSVLSAVPPVASSSRVDLATGPFQSGPAGTNVFEQLSTAADAPELSADGRWMAFAAFGVPPESTSTMQVFVKDTWSGHTEQVSVSSSGQKATAASSAPRISADGRYVVFGGGGELTSPSGRIKRRDRFTGTTITVDRSNSGQGNHSQVSDVTVSDDASRVAFESSNPHLANPAVGYTRGNGSLYVRHIDEGRTELVSLDHAGNQIAGQSWGTKISGDGTKVIFNTSAPGVVPVDPAPGAPSVYLRDLEAGTTERVSLGWNGATTPGSAAGMDLSDDGRYVLFIGHGPGFVPGYDGSATVYLRDRLAETTTVVSTTPAGAPRSGGEARLSGDGSVATFLSEAPGMPGAANGRPQLYMRRLPAGTTQLASLGSLGQVPNARIYHHALADDGTVAFVTSASNLTTPPQERQRVHLRRRQAIAPFTSTVAWVDRQYRDFAGRPPTASERTTWTNRIRDGWHPSRLPAALATSPAWVDRRAAVTRLYWAYFLRRPDTGGLSFWIERSRKGTSIHHISSSFAASSEFKNRYGSLNNGQFVDLIYQNILGRAADSSGRAYWVRQLNNGMARGRVMTGFSESSEGVRLMAPQVLTTLVGLGMLRAIPSPALFDQSVAALRFGARLEEVVRMMQVTPGYQARG